MNSYFVRLKGHDLGPYSLDRMRQMTRRGEVGRSHEVSTDGMSWAPATTFPEIFERVEPSPVYSPAVATQAPAVVEAVSTAAPVSAPVAASFSDSQWYYDHQGAAQGPIPLAQLVGMAQRGEISATSYVFKEGTANWVTAREAPELATAFQTTATGAMQPGVDAFCRSCGGGISSRAVVCPKCGSPTGAAMLPAGHATDLPTAFSHGHGGHVTIEKTSKSLKISLLAGFLCFAFGAVLAVSGAAAESLPVAGIGIATAFAGIVWWIGTKVRIWWHHG